MNLRVSINRHIIGKDEKSIASNPKTWETPPDGWKPDIFRDLVTTRGYAWSYVFEAGHRLGTNFLGTSVLALDFDGGLTFADASARDFVREFAWFIYTTPSHTEEANRFRVVFQLDREIGSEEFAEAIRVLLAMFPEADGGCKDRARAWFGNPEADVEKIDETLPVDVLLRATVPKPDQKPERIEVSGGPIEPGDRHAALSQFAAKEAAIHGNRIRNDDVEGFRLAVRGFNEERCDPPKEREEVDRICTYYETKEREERNQKGSDEAAPLVQMWDAAQLMRHSFPPIEWLAEGAIERNTVTTIYGPPGSGKSLIALDLIVSVVQGHEKWMGLPIRESGEGVIYFSNENSPEITQTRLLALTGGDEKALSKVRVFQYPPPFQDFRETLDQHAEASQSALFVFDSIYLGMRGGMDENNPSQVRPFVKEVREYTGRHNLATVVVHHSTKNSQNPDTDFHIRNIRGAVIGDNSNNALELRIGKEERERVFAWTKVRNDVGGLMHKVHTATLNPQTLKLVGVEEKQKERELPPLSVRDVMKEGRNSHEE